MRKTLRTLMGGAAIGAIAGIPLSAQIVREGARSNPNDAQITFGYLCDDRFVVRNEGDKDVRLEYGLAKNDERTSLALEKGESVELLLSTSDDLNLYSGNGVIATARRAYRVEFGNVGRNVLTVPGIMNWDFITMKTFKMPFAENHNLQFRLEAFNFPNHPNWNSPDTGILSGGVDPATGVGRNFGRITGTRGMRNLQLGLRYTF